MSDDEETPDNVFDDADPSKVGDELRDYYEAELLRLRSKVATLEINALEDDHNLRKLLLAEIRQRIYMRRGAATIGTLIIAYMCYTMVHISHASMPPWWWPAPSSRSSALAIAMFVVPATSATAITIAFLFGVFRRFRDDDLQIDKAGLAGEIVKSQIGS